MVGRGQHRPAIRRVWRRSHNQFEGPDLHAKDDGLDATAMRALKPAKPRGQTRSSAAPNEAAHTATRPSLRLQLPMDGLALGRVHDNDHLGALMPLAPSTSSP